MNYLSKNLRWLRGKKGWSQEGFSCRLKVKYSTYRTWEQYIIPPIEILRRLSLLYSVSIEYLVRRDLSQLDPAKVENDFNLVQGQLRKIDVLNSRAN